MRQEALYPLLLCSVLCACPAAVAVVGAVGMSAGCRWSEASTHPQIQRASSSSTSSRSTLEYQRPRTRLAFTCVAHRRLDRRLFPSGPNAVPVSARIGVLPVPHWANLTVDGLAKGHAPTIPLYGTPAAAAPVPCGSSHPTRFASPSVLAPHHQRSTARWPWLLACRPPSRTQPACRVASSAFHPFRQPL